MCVLKLYIFAKCGSENRRYRKGCIILNLAFVSTHMVQTQTNLYSFYYIIYGFFVSSSVFYAVESTFSDDII